MAARLFVGNLTYGVRSQDLDNLFSKYGKIIDISVKDWAQGSVYAFVEFDNVDDAENALNSINGEMFMGNKIRIEFTRGEKIVGKRDQLKRKPPHRTPYRVEVYHLPRGCSWQDLKDFMRQAGEVGYCVLRRNYAVVEYETYDDMKRAVRKLDDIKMRSRDETSYVRIVNCYRKHRSSSHSRSYSDSRSRSRSYSHSKSHSRKRSSSRSRSYSSRSKSSSKSRSRSRSYSDSKSRSRSYSKSYSQHSASGSPKPAKQELPQPDTHSESTHQSASRLKASSGRSHSRSHSPSTSRSRSRSYSYSYSYSGSYSSNTPSRSPSSKKSRSPSPRK